MALIDKDKLVAKINELKEHFVNERDDFERGYHSSLNAVSDYLDTLEVKKMDIDELRKELKKAVEIYKPTGNFGWGTLYNIAWHFYELGLKAKKGE